MRTTTNLSLNVWDQTTDNFSHTQLADNWDKIDAHDHTGGTKGLLIGTNALANNAVTNAKLASNAVSTANILDANITAVKLTNNTLTAAQMNTAFANGNVEGAFGSFRPVTPWLGGPASPSGGGAWVLAPGSVIDATSNGGRSNAIWYFDPADYQTGGRTLKWRLRTMIAVNQVAPAASFQFWIESNRNVAVYGATGSPNQYQAGGPGDANTVGSILNYTTPAASTTTMQTSPVFNAPTSAGWFSISVGGGPLSGGGSRFDLLATVQMQIV